MWFLRYSNTYSLRRKSDASKWDKCNKWYNNGMPRERYTGNKVLPEWEMPY